MSDEHAVVINQYKILSHIGSGSFGNVYKALDTQTNKFVAMKIPIENKDRDNQKWILEEAKIYQKISNPKKGICDVNIIQKKNKNIIVMDLLGDSLGSLISKHKKFGLKTVILIGIKIIKILKYIHSKNYLHRDLKPDNFTIGFEKDEINKIYCIDFGLAKKTVCKNGKLIKREENHKFLGTSRYASINAHKGVTQSYKDDMESLGYLLVYFYKGKLPWQNLKTSNKEKRNKMILECKSDIERSILCSGLPKQFLIYFNYVDSLEYGETPKYNTIIKMFEKLYLEREYTNSKLEWEDIEKNNLNNT